MKPRAKKERSHPAQTRKKAVAVHYESQQDAAPKIIAKGEGLIAEQIIAIAKEHNIHIHEDPDMVAILSKLSVDTEIPESLYRAVAEILAFVYRLNKKFP